MLSNVEGGISVPSSNRISNLMAICGLLNGMIGGTILLLPIIGLNTGYLMSGIISIFVGVCSYYTGNLTVVHLGTAKDMKECILQHFDGKYGYMIVYSFVVWIGQIPLLILYYNLICIQLEGLFGESEWISIVVGCALLLGSIQVLSVDLGQQTMGIGIISILSYLVFVIWALITAPEGDKQVPLIGNPNNLISALLFAYGIHDLIVQNIIKNDNKQDYKWITLMTFIGGAIVYTFVAQGSFGIYDIITAIVNRTSFKKIPQTIQDYFQPGSIQVSIIQILYLFHLATVYPQYLKLSKIRFFNIVKLQVSKQFTFKQFAYCVIVVGLCFVVQKLSVSLQTLVNINGALVSNLLVVVMPLAVHIKCVYIDGFCGQIEGEIQENDKEVEIIGRSRCHYQYRHKIWKYLQMVFMVFLLVLGSYVMIDSLKTL